MSTDKNKQALQAMRAKYKETFGEEPAANLGLPQLTKKIKDFEEGVTAPAADPVAQAATIPAPDVTAAVNPTPETTAPAAPVVEVQAATPEATAPAVIDPVGTGELESPEVTAPVSRKNQTPITAADMKVEKVMITNGKVTKPYTKFAWDNFLSKAPGKWRIVADVPPEVKSLVND